jgi:xanthine dehydrogenase accessory factor
MNPKSFEEYLSEREKLVGKGRPFVTATLVQIEGSAPQDVGAKALVGEQGLIWGSVGGGKVEKYIIEKAILNLQQKNHQPHFEKVNLQRDLGMSCGGTASCFLEPWYPELKWQIVVFGAGHVAQELIRTLIRLDLQVTCVDSREDWLDKLPSHGRLLKKFLKNPADLVSAIPDSAYLVVMTMGHATDLPILEKALTKNFPYVGAIGSDTKAKRLRAELGDKADRLICPIGENFGGNDPVEIALSVTAQLLKKRDQLQGLAHPRR